MRGSSPPSIFEFKVDWITRRPLCMCHKPVWFERDVGPGGQEVNRILHGSWMEPGHAICKMFAS